MGLFSGVKLEDLSTEEYDEDLADNEIEALHEAIDVLLEQLNLIDEIYSADSNIMSIMANSYNEELAIVAAKYDTLCKIYDIPITGGNLSTEALIDKSSANRNFLSDAANRAVTAIGNIFATFGTLPRLFMSHNANKLKKYKEMINNGTLVPRTSLDPKQLARFNEKMKVFYALGNTLESDTNDFITYLNKPVEDINNGKYTSILGNSFMVLFSEKNAEKDWLTVDLSKFHFKLKIDPKDKALLFSFVVRSFGPKLVLGSFVIPNESADKADAKDAKSGESIFYTTAGFNVDIVKLGDDVIKPIKPLSPDKAVKLLEYGITSEPAIKKAITTTKKDFVKFTVVTFIEDIIASAATKALPFFKSLGFIGNIAIGQTYRTLLYTALQRTHVNLYSKVTFNLKAMISYDRLIIEYIDLTYGKKV